MRSVSLITRSWFISLCSTDTPKVTNNNDLFAMPIPQQIPSVAAQTISAPQMVASSSAPSLSSPSQPPATNGIANDVDLFGQETSSSSSSSTSGKTSKESILALFGNQPSQQQQMYNVPGIHLKLIECDFCSHIFHNILTSLSQVHSWILFCTSSIYFFAPYDMQRCMKTNM